MGKLKNIWDAVWGFLSHADTIGGWSERIAGWIGNGAFGFITGSIAAMFYDHPWWLWGLYGLTIVWAFLALVWLKRHGWLKSLSFPMFVVSGFAFLYWNQQKLQKDLECYALPRTLTAKQSETLTEYLLQYEPHDFVFRVESGDQEASQYRGAIWRSLRAANWHQTTIEYDDDIQPGGVGVSYQQSMKMQEERSKRRPTDSLYPDEIIKQAFGAAGIPISGGRGGQVRGVTEYTLWIEIGPKRRDQGWCEYITEGDI